MNDTRMTIRISDLIHAVFKNRILIAVLTVAGLAVGIILSIVSYMRGEMSKEYVINTSIAVTSQNENGLFTSQTNDPNQNDIYLAESMVDSVIYVMKSDNTIDKAVDKLKLVGISAKDIIGNISMNQYNETQIIEISLYWRSAEEGVQILDALNTVAPGVLVDTLKIGGVSVVNKPTARYRIGGSVNASVWVYMAVLGMAAGIGLSIMKLLLSPTITNVKDIEKAFELEIIGEIPENVKYFRKKGSLLVEDSDGIGDDVREGFASAAHILQNRLGSDKHQCIYFTSADQNEGKTHTVANLAVQLSDLEKKILLIDFDVRNPSLGNIFMEKLDYGRSLNALYRGEATEEEAITHLTGYLDLLPAILEHRGLPLSDAMMDMVKRLSEQYDYVLMDTAPVGRVADTLNLNKISDAAVFIIRYDTTRVNDIRDALERMDKSGIRTIGCIANGVKGIAKKKYKYNYYNSGSASKRKEKAEK